MCYRQKLYKYTSYFMIADEKAVFLSTQLKIKFKPCQWGLEYVDCISPTAR